MPEDALALKVIQTRGPGLYLDAVQGPAKA